LAIQEELGQSVGVYANREAVEAARGLTEFEAETAFALSLVIKKEFCPDIITEQKKQMIRRTGLMEFWPPVPIDQVGGLDLFKQHLTNRMKAFEPGNEHLPKPKALLLVGIPGTGKSLSCKAAASILNWPLIRLDISALKGSLVGESERKIRQATATIDAFGKAVVWLDEIDKGFSGVKSSGQTDGGTTSSMFGHYAELIVMRSPLFASPATGHFGVFLLRIKEPFRKEAISLSVAWKRPDRNFGATIDSSASSFTEESARVYISVVCMFACPSQRETFRRSLVACRTVSAQVCRNTWGETRFVNREGQ
jgi:SpoVK/Ycf46/Vps4 family AAA+-type ATPase